MKIELKQLLLNIKLYRIKLYESYHNADKIVSAKQVEVVSTLFKQLCDNLYSLFTHLSAVDKHYEKITHISQINATRLESDYQLLIYVQNFFKNIKLSPHHMLMINNEFKIKFPNSFKSINKENIETITKLWNSLYGHFEDRSFLERVESCNGNLLQLRDYKLRKLLLIEDFYEHFNIKPKKQLDLQYIQKLELSKSKELIKQ